MYPNGNDPIELTVTLACGALPLGAELQGVSLVDHAETADRLKVEREIRLSGDAQGVARFDGSADVNIYTGIERLTNEEIEEMLT